MKGKVKRALVEALELPKESVFDIPLITLVGKEELTLENYKGIIEYTATKVRIKTGIGTLCVEGDNLLLKAILLESITIKGRICSVSFFS